MKNINVIVETESLICFIFKDYSRKKWLRKCYKDYFIYKFKPLFNKITYVEHPSKLAVFNHPIQDIHPLKNTSTSFLTITSTNVDTKPKTFARLVSALLLDLCKILRPHLVPAPNYETSAESKECLFLSRRKGKPRVANFIDIFKTTTMFIKTTNKDSKKKKILWITMQSVSVFFDKLEVADFCWKNSDVRRTQGLHHVIRIFFFFLLIFLR